MMSICHILKILLLSRICTSKDLRYCIDSSEMILLSDFISIGRVVEVAFKDTLLILLVALLDWLRSRSL
jgi:hypothetical protein